MYFDVPASATKHPSAIVFVKAKAGAIDVACCKPQCSHSPASTVEQLNTELSSVFSPLCIRCHDSSSLERSAATAGYAFERF